MLALEVRNEKSSSATSTPSPYAMSCKNGRPSWSWHTRPVTELGVWFQQMLRSGGDHASGIGIGEGWMCVCRPRDTSTIERMNGVLSSASVPVGTSRLHGGSHAPLRSPPNPNASNVWNDRRSEGLLFVMGSAGGNVPSSYISISSTAESAIRISPAFFSKMIKRLSWGPYVLSPAMEILRGRAAAIELTVRDLDLSGASPKSDPRLCLMSNTELWALWSSPTASWWTKLILRAGCGV